MQYLYFFRKLAILHIIFFHLYSNYRTKWHYRTLVIVHRTQDQKLPKLSYNYRIIVHLATLLLTLIILLYSVRFVFTPPVY